MSYPTTARRRLARASMAAAIACALLAGTAFAAIPSKGPAAAPPPAGSTVDRAALPIGAAARAQLRLTRVARAYRGLRAGRADRHAPDRGQARRVPHRPQRRCADLGRPRVRANEPRRVRSGACRPSDAATAQGLRGHRWHPPPVVRAAGRRALRVRTRTGGGRHRRRPVGERHRRPGARGPRERGRPPRAHPRDPARARLGRRRGRPHPW